jgi:hypothetical protein
MYIAIGTRFFPFPLCSSNYNKSYFDRPDGSKRFLGILTETSMLSRSSIRSAHTITSAKGRLRHSGVVGFRMNDRVRVGARAPDFTLPSQTGGMVRLKDFLGKPVVLFFYPKDNTLGCTKEVCAFRDGFGESAS